MSESVNKKTATVALLIGCASLWAASQWWEKGLATTIGTSTISPSGCYRVDTLKPRWLLPNIFHVRVHPDASTKPEWFPWWGYAGFYRLYDNRTGELIGESGIYDLTVVSGQIHWGTRRSPRVSAGLIAIGSNTADCVGDRPTTPQAKQ